MPWYTERQRFAQPWLFVIVFLVAALLWYNTFFRVVLGIPIDDSAAPEIVFVGIWLIGGIGVPLLLLLARLDTEVREDGLHVRFLPFHRKPRHWPFDEIVLAEPRVYAPIREYGGWGIRYGRDGMAYNAHGNRGVQLVLRSGKRLLIGSQHPELLAQAIRRGIRD